MTESKPVYIGMPAAERTFDVRPWGKIKAGGVCRDSYERIEVHTYNNGGEIALQRAALDSFLDAEKALNRRIPLTGSIRTCALQTKLWKSDPARYANPDTSAHPRGLAIDVDQGQSQQHLSDIHRALTNRDWHQVRADEPWHYSFGIEV